MDNSINFTPALRDKLRKEYTQAVEQGKDTFSFEGHVLVTGYAKYLLEYLDGKFK